MAIEKNQIYKTPDNRIVRVKTVRESGIHTLETIDENGNVIGDVKNHFGHVIDRSDRLCSEQTIRTFKKQK